MLASREVKLAASAERVSDLTLGNIQENLAAWRVTRGRKRTLATRPLRFGLQSAAARFVPLPPESFALDPPSPEAV